MAFVVPGTGLLTAGGIGTALLLRKARPRVRGFKMLGSCGKMRISWRFYGAYWGNMVCIVGKNADAYGIYQGCSLIVRGSMDGFYGKQKRFHGDLWSLKAVVS